jgi:hypothetical protein
VGHGERKELKEIAPVIRDVVEEAIHKRSGKRRVRAARFLQVPPATLNAPVGEADPAPVASLPPPAGALPESPVPESDQDDHSPAGSSPTVDPAELDVSDWEVASPDLWVFLPPATLLGRLVVFLFAINPRRHLMPSEVKAKDIADRQQWRKVPSEDRIAYANTLLVLHPRFREAVGLLDRCHQGSKQGGEPVCGTILGASGVGKTSVVEHYCRLRPAQETDHGTRQPLLKVIGRHASPASLTRRGRRPQPMRQRQYPLSISFRKLDTGMKTQGLLFPSRTWGERRLMLSQNSSHAR